MYKKITAIIIILLLILVAFFSIFVPLDTDNNTVNHKPSVAITYPYERDTVSKIVTISGTASDPDGDETLERVELLIDDEWKAAEGNATWIYTWEIYDV